MQVCLRLIGCGFLATSVLAGPTHDAYGSERRFPYNAVVSVGSATVFSGPGPHYYDTAELPAGAEVQVYEETPAGFCAIRPPEGSFSWLPASAAQLFEDGTAEVTRDQAPARVGSLLHERRDAVHVRLDKGERVRVLAQQEIDGVRWLQIAPPSGEFRWVRREQVRAAGESPASVAEPIAAEQDSGWVQTAAHNTEEQPTSESTDPANPSGEATGARPLPAVDSDPPAGAAQPRSVSPQPQLALTGDFAQKMSTLEVELARQVTERPTLWRFDEIEQHAAALLAAAQDDSQRAAVRGFAARVDRFAAIANRYKATRGIAPQVALTKTTTPGLTPPRVVPLGEGGIGEGPAGESGYDAIGVLRPVVSKRPEAPQYALVDQQGKIVSFITASPDLNLGSLIGQRVGVQGVKGFMPEYQQSHVTAQRVASLGTGTQIR